MKKIFARLLMKTAKLASVKNLQKNALANRN